MFHSPHPVGETFLTLDEEEFALASSNHTEKNRLTFAIMLKFFQEKGRYPTGKDTIESALVYSLAGQLKISPALFDLPHLEHRTAKRFRHKIREFLGYKVATLSDVKELITWLMDQVKQEPHSIPRYLEMAYEFLRQHKIEPFSPQKMDRYIRSAIAQFEKRFFTKMAGQLSSDTIALFDRLLHGVADDDVNIEPDDLSGPITLRCLKSDIAGVQLKHVAAEIKKLAFVRSVPLPDALFDGISRKHIKKYYLRIMAASPGNILEFVPHARLACMACFVYMRSQLLTDSAADLLIRLIHNMKTSAESHVNKKVLFDVKKVNGKFDILHTMAATAIDHPKGVTEDTIFARVSRETLQNIVNEMKHSGNRWYVTEVNTKVRSLYSHAHRKTLLALLSAFPFQSNYEVAMLEAFREKLRCKSIWIEGAYRYRNPDEDLPSDWETCREACYLQLGLPLSAAEFVRNLKGELHCQLQNLNDSIPHNNKVKILDKDNGHIKITPITAQPEPVYLDALQREINRRWSTINLIDMLKEADWRIGFTKQFQTVASREILEGDLLQKRLLLCLYALGSNTGLKRVSAANSDSSHSDLTYVKRRFIHEDNVKAAIVDVVNAIIEIRDPAIWGESTTGCACDSTQVSSWDQNLMTQRHPRHKERGIMIYWHIDTKSAVVHSHIKTCLSSEVGSMITGVLRHDTKMNMNKTYVDTHGQSTIGFAISHGLNFDLLPRIKGIHRQKLHCPTADHKNRYPNLTSVLKSAIHWRLIEENYDEYVKHLAALKTGTVEADVLIKKFSREDYHNPVYKAFTEIGNAVKTIFLCRYLASEVLRIEINESLNVVERLNGIMHFIFYGKLGELSSNRTREQSLAVSCLHLLQVCMVYINTLIIQEILSEPAWADKLTPEDKRALTPLIHAHINLYGLFPLDLYQRLLITILEKSTQHDRINTHTRQTESEAIS